MQWLGVRDWPSKSQVLTQMEGIYFTWITATCGAPESSHEGKTDTTKRINGEIAKIEIKCNAFEIERLDENGAVTYSIRNNDYIVYAPDYNEFAPVEMQAYVIPAGLFVDKLYECGCVRLKMTTPMAARKKAGEPFFYDRISIQNNSIKKLNLIYDILDEYGMSLKEFKAMVCGA